MDSTTMIQVVSGVLFVIVLGMVIGWRRALVKWKAAGKHRFGAGLWG
jgi:membrane protein CcdC involved in cytochrome C biogenesis